MFERDYSLMRLTLCIDFLTRLKSKSQTDDSLITPSMSFFAVTPLAVQMAYTSLASVGSSS